MSNSILGQGSLTVGSHHGNSIQAAGGSFSLASALVSSNSLANTTIDSSCSIKPQAMPNGTLVFDEKTGRLMVKTDDGMQAINEGRRPPFSHEEPLAFPDGTRITVSLEHIAADVGETARFKAFVGQEHVRSPQMEQIIALGFPIPDSEQHLFDNLSIGSICGFARSLVVFSVEFAGGSTAVDAALLAASVSHLHKPIVGDISFSGGSAVCTAIRSHTGDLSLGKGAFEHFKTEFERYTVILS